MSEPTSADVRAAVERLKHSLDVMSSLTGNAEKHLDDAALALLMERLAQAEGALADRDRAYDAPHEDHARLTERSARLEAYATHKQECAVRFFTKRPCTCGLAALLPPATEGR